MYEFNDKITASKLSRVADNVTALYQHWSYKLLWQSNSNSMNFAAKLLVSCYSKLTIVKVSI